MARVVEEPSAMTRNGPCGVVEEPSQGLCSIVEYSLGVSGGRALSLDYLGSI